MIPYILALAVLVFYWVGHSRPLTLWAWINSNPKLAIMQLAAVVLVVALRNLLAPIAALWFVVTVVQTLSIATLLDKVTKFWTWITGLLNPPKHG
jgi:hypothetical protein